MKLSDKFRLIADAMDKKIEIEMTTSIGWLRLIYDEISEVFCTEKNTRCALWELMYYKIRAVPKIPHD